MTMTQDDAIAEIRADLDKLKSANSAKDAEITTLKSENEALTTQIGELNAKAAASNEVSPELAAAITDLHALAQGSSSAAQS